MTMSDDAERAAVLTIRARERERVARYFSEGLDRALRDAEAAAGGRPPPGTVIEVGWIKFVV